jgi:hypothetical protein
MSTPGDLTAHQNVGVDPRVCQKWGVRRDRYPESGGRDGSGPRIVIHGRTITHGGTQVPRRRAIGKEEP